MEGAKINMIQSDVQVDAKGLSCPMPIVKTKKTIEDVQEGQVLEVQATDKGSIADLEAWCKSVGHQYIGHVQKEGVIYHYIRKCNVDEKMKSEKTFERTITNEEAISGTGIILDVREEAEFMFGHLPGAKSIPLGELEKRMDELNKEETIYVICRTGTRSDLAAKQLVEAGFKDVFNVLPGMEAYEGELEREV